MDQEIYVENAIIKQLPTSLLHLIGMYNPFFLEFKKMELMNIIDWSYIIAEIFDIHLNKLLPHEGANTFINLFTIKQESMPIYILDLARNYRIAKSGSLIKQVIAGNNYYLLWMMDNTIRFSINYKNISINNPMIFKPVIGLTNVQSIISNNYYSIIRTHNEMWYMGNSNLLSTLNSPIYFKMVNVPNNISLISADKFHIFLLLTDGTVVYLSALNNFGSNLVLEINGLTFKPLNLEEKCIDMISTNRMTILQLANGKIYSTENLYYFKNIAKMSYFTFSRDNLFKSSDNFLLLLDNGIIYTDNSGMWGAIEFIADIKLIDIKKLILLGDNRNQILFFLMKNGDLYYYINKFDNEFEKLPIENVIDINVYDNDSAMIRTKTEVFHIKLNSHATAFLLNFFDWLEKPFLTFFGRKMRLVDGTIIVHENYKILHFSKDNEHFDNIDHYSDFGYGFSIFVIGNDIFYETYVKSSKSGKLMIPQLVKVTMRLENGCYCESIPKSFVTGDILFPIKIVDDTTIIQLS